MSRKFEKLWNFWKICRNVEYNKYEIKWEVNFKENLRRYGILFTKFNYIENMPKKLYFWSPETVILKIMSSPAKNEMDLPQNTRLVY